VDYIQEFEKRVKQLDVDSAAENRATFVAALREGIREEGKISRLLSILAFVEGCDYSKHPGGGATSAYVNHLLRVANFSLEFFTEHKEEAVVLSLVHNMYEVSDVSEAGLAEVVGEGLARAVTLLSVDRSRQWDAGY
jgi:(p)ppGpp synthase/HD superfamily hydrolase